MSRYIDAEWLKGQINTTFWAEIGKIIDNAPSIDIVKCVDCRKCKEQGGHANCNGYLYCTRQKTLVDEDCFCAWGEER